VTVSKRATRIKSLLFGGNEKRCGRENRRGKKNGLGYQRVKRSISFDKKGSLMPSGHEPETSNLTKGQTMPRVHTGQRFFNRHQLGSSENTLIRKAEFIEEKAWTGSRPREKPVGIRNRSGGGKSRGAMLLQSGSTSRGRRTSFRGDLSE